MIKRTVYIKKLLNYKDKNIIKVITGLRRCGKSTLLKQYMQSLKELGVESDQIIHIDFDDIVNEKLLDYHVLYDLLLERKHKNNSTYYFLDEIQNVNNFEKVINSLYLKENVDIYITGSNSKMLSGELATFLSGRYIEIQMYPLSFSEYCESCSCELSKNDIFNLYLKNGSLPYTLQLDNNIDTIRDYYQSVYNTIILKDIVARYKISDVTLLESIIKFIFDNVGNTISSKKISDTLNSLGRKTSALTVENYLKYLEDTFLIYHIGRYDIKGKGHLKTLGKYYISDIGFRNMLIGNKDLDSGFIIENIVYIELRRRGFKVDIGKINDLEIDFLATKGNQTYYYQVTKSLFNDDVKSRELKPFNYINDHYDKIIVTYDKQFIDNYNGIKVINLIDFLLN